MQKICIYQKKVVPLHQILKITLLTIKIFNIMSNKNYLHLRLPVHFTMNEMMIIANALYKEWSYDKDQGYNLCAKEISEIRNRLLKQAEQYNEIIK